MNNSKNYRNEILEHLSTSSISIYFSYDPFGSSIIECTPIEFSTFFEEALFDYIFQTGDPLGGYFKVFRQENKIIIESKNLTEISRNYSTQFPETDKKVLEMFIREKLRISEENWYYNVELSFNSNTYDFDLEVYSYSYTEEDFVKVLFPAKNVFESVKNLTIELSRKLNLNYFDLFLTNSEDPDSLVEYESIRIVL